MAQSTLQQFRDHARTVFDLDTADLSDVTLDRWIKNAYGRVLRSRKQWPHMEAAATIPIIGGTQSYDLPTATSTNGRSGQLRHIIAIQYRNRQLNWTDHAEMLRRYQYNALVNVTNPPYYSQFNRKLYLWPIPNATGENATVYGIREPDLTWLSSPTGTPDLPEFYDAPMMSWVLSEVAKQQNDLNQANNFAQDFEIELNELNGTEIVPPMYQPIVMNGGTPRVWAMYPWAAGVSWP